MSARLTIVALACLISASALALADEARHVNVPAGNLIEGLESLAGQCGVDVIYPSNELKGLKTHGVSGTFEPKEAFRKLIEGTPLILREQGNALLISLPGAATHSQSSNPSDTVGADNQSQEGKSKSSGNFLLAQVDQGQASGPSAVERQDDQASEKKPVQLEEVVITGSRIPTVAGQGPQEVNVYSKEQIDQSGQTTVTDFLNTLPDVSVGIGENGNQTIFGTTTVQLHGLPFGTTLVLIDGRRVEASGVSASNGQNFFDLNSLPVGIVERIEIVPEGSSAIYGSDAIAGVINIILKKSFNGLEIDGKYGEARDINESDASVAWGKQWERGSFSIVGTFQNRGALLGVDRALTASNDYTAYGGPNNNLPVCNPGNVFSLTGQALPGAPPGSGATFAAVTNTAKPGKPAFGDFNYGALNTCDLFADQSFIPALDRGGLFATGNFHLTDAVELFSELMYSHTRTVSQGAGPSLFGESGYQQYTASAQNPFNPFGQSVGVAYQFNDFGVTKYTLDTDFFRPLLGARGLISDSWHWEVAAWKTQDQEQYRQNDVLNATAVQAALDSPNPASALNVFSTGSPGSPQLLQSLIGQDVAIFYASKTTAADAVLRGALPGLPAGLIDVAIGGEYGRDTLYQDVIQEQPYFLPYTRTSFHRTRYAAFGEAKVPLVARHANPQAGDVLAVTIAERYDDYSDFGDKATPQFGVEFRPIETLLIRGSYGRSFQAPSLPALYTPTTTFQAFAPDQLRNNEIETFNVTTGGNPNLRPETGYSRTFGVVYSNDDIAGLRLSVTQWSIEEANAIQQLPYDVLIENENLFPSYVIRAASCAGSPPCPIVEVSDTDVNFGQIHVSGFDYQVGFRVNTAYGQWIPAASANQTYQYTTEFTPNSPPVERAGIASDDGNWAPKWKGTMSLGWKLDDYTVAIDGRYIGRYQDYDSTRIIGNFWLCDADVRYSIGHALAPKDWLAGAFIEWGAVNLFNRLPQFSNFQEGTEGYDPAQGDLRGRFLYMRLGLKL